MKTVICLFLIAIFSCSAEEVAFDRYMSNALGNIKARNYKLAISQIKIGINVYWTHESDVSRELEGEYQSLLSNESDHVARAHLYLGLAAFQFIKKQIGPCRNLLDKARLENDKLPEFITCRVDC